ncbi:MAG: ShlB/FhaC/HecB family hemolysin secretion/activation protein [Parasphingorhabdus sp.]
MELSQIEFAGTGGQAVAPEITRALSKVMVPPGIRPLAVVCQVRDEANAILRQSGWIASASLPPQNVDGSLRIAITSGTINEVKIEGDAGPYSDTIDSLTSKLRQLNPLNEYEVERILLNAIDVPGLDVRLTLAPSKAGRGQIDGTLKVNFIRFAGFANIRNLNARSVGRETVFGRIEFYGLTGLSDSSYLGAQSTIDFKEQFVVQAGHEFGIGLDNVRIGAGVVYAESRPSVGRLDIKTDTLVANLFASYPLIRTPASALDLSIGFDFADQSTDLGPLRLSQDSIRTLYLRAELDGQKRRLNRSTSLLYNGFIEVRRGLSIFDATEFGPTGFAQTGNRIASRPFGSATATVFRGGVDVTWLTDTILDARAKVEGQWTDDPLLSFDEFAVGNLSIGRGYDPGANSGDRAIGAQFELGANLISEASKRLQLFGFFDIVQIENLDPRTPQASRTLRSVGGGLRFNLTRGLNAELVYAAPLTPALFGDRENPPQRLLFSITTQFPALVR